MYVSFAVLVQSWDHHVKDGFKKSKNVSDSKSFSTWDGTRSSKVAEELEKQSSAIGYGSSGKCMDIHFYIQGLIQK